MSVHGTHKGIVAVAAAAALIASLAGFAFFMRPAAAANTAQACPGDNGGLTLSPGFCATIFADNLGHVRDMIVAPNGVLYVNTWSGDYYENNKHPQGSFIVALKDSKGTGHADVIERFGPTGAEGSAGGSGIAFYNDAIYAEMNDRILRFPLPNGAIVPTDKPEVVLSGMPLTGDHPMHPFVIDAKGNLFVDMGSATNSCQYANRMVNSFGRKPCTELETRGGTWRYDANKTGQKFSPAERYATGLRNGEGFAFDSAGRLFATQHGRDQLWQNWPKFYTPRQGAELPAEELVEEKQGADFGWPECYFDGIQKKLVLAPEYGGDGKTVGVCATKQAPVAFFPGHWAPNDLLIDNEEKFPAAYRGGAFIAFHGSWNRAPLPQGGYNVVFQALKHGKAAGEFVVFADGFAGAYKEPGRATFRPSGLAAGPDGALYISDDIHGRIWRVTYHGAPNAGIAPAPSTAATASTSANAVPPEGIHPEAGGSDTSALPLAPGVTRDQLALGDRIFHGEASDGTCSGCHGSDAKGSPIGPNLTSGSWAWGDGSLAAITQTITAGVQHPKNFSGAMPAMGGVQLSSAAVKAVAAYVWAISRGKQKG